MLQIQSFAGAANQLFELSLGESSMSLTLIEVKPLPSRPFAGMLRDPFSLMFKSASPVILPQRQYRLRNESVGIVDLFLVPVARARDGICYQALFN